VTLGTSSDEQKIEALEGSSYKSFMLHYKFPPFSVGEVKFLRGPSRREVGHGALAARSLSYLLPNDEEFPYTIRVVSEILESNGSSSMATVCGASLSLMDAGVPLAEPVAGIAMGLLKDDGRVIVLSDIIGDEDHHGDMDFKVAGTREGITALQMDIKIEGITREVLTQALFQARDGRRHILDKMAETISASKAEISPYAPRIFVMYVNPDRIRDIIGPGGKVIRAIQEETNTKIEVDDTGKVVIASVDVECGSASSDRRLGSEMGRKYGTVAGHRLWCVRGDLPRHRRPSTSPSLSERVGRMDVVREGTLSRQSDRIVFGVRSAVTERRDQRLPTNDGVIPPLAASTESSTAKPLLITVYGLLRKQCLTCNPFHWVYGCVPGQGLSNLR
jgi:ribonuclease PH